MDAQDEVGTALDRITEALYAVKWASDAADPALSDDDRQALDRARQALELARFELAALLERGV